MNHTHPPSRLRGLLLLAACAAAAFPAPVRADFTNFAEGTLSTGYGYASFGFDQLSTGRLIYGSEGTLFRQKTYGTAPLDFFKTGQAFDPSSVRLYSDTLGAIGGYNAIYLFNPAILSAGITTVPNVSLQTYTVTFRDSTSLYVGGANGSEMNSSPAPFTGPKHAISWVKTDGSASKTIIDNISDFSGDFTADAAGNLYVTDNDNLGVYKFSKTLLDQVIQGTHAVLHISDGVSLGTLGDTSSIAVDAAGRIYYAGFRNNGFSVFDPATGATNTFAPNGANSNYQVATYTFGGQEYISYLDVARGSNPPLTYGYDLVVNVPEPASWWLLAGGAVVFVNRRRRHALRC